jgi:hypothetical protein
VEVRQVKHADFFHYIHRVAHAGLVAHELLVLLVVAFDLYKYVKMKRADLVIPSSRRVADVMYGVSCCIRDISLSDVVL